MSPRMPWETESAELLNPLNGIGPAPQTHGERGGAHSARSVVQHSARGEALHEAIRRFNAEVDLVELLERRGEQGSLKRRASTNGGEWAGPCPLCGGEDRFRVWPTPPDGKPGAWCRQCQAGGDALTWAVRLEGRDPLEPGATVATLRGYGLI